MLDAIKKRCSRRSFTDKNIDTVTLNDINVMIDEINLESGLSIRLTNNGAKAFDGFTKSYGFFKGVKYVLLLKGDRHDDDFYEKIGYYGEEIVLRLTKLGIDTCWVGGTYLKDAFLNLIDNEEIACVIALGYATQKLGTNEKLVKTITSKKRKKSIYDRLVCKAVKPQWLNDAMECVLLAPSALNSQKPVFTYKKGTVTAKTEVSRPFDLVDLGIAKKHFEIGGNGKFQLGANGVFVPNN